MTWNIWTSFPPSLSLECTPVRHALAAGKYHCVIMCTLRYTLFINSFPPVFISYHIARNKSRHCCSPLPLSSDHHCVNLQSYCLTIRLSICYTTETTNVFYFFTPTQNLSLLFLSWICFDWLVCSPFFCSSSSSRALGFLAFHQSSWFFCSPWRPGGIHDAKTGAAQQVIQTLSSNCSLISSQPLFTAFASKTQRDQIYQSVIRRCLRLTRVPQWINDIGLLPGQQYLQHLHEYERATVTNLSLLCSLHPKNSQTFKVFFSAIHLSPRGETYSRLPSPSIDSIRLSGRNMISQDFVLHRKIKTARTAKLVRWASD